MLAGKLSAFSGTPYFFEHGNWTPGGLTGCGVDHAHLHIVPLPFDLLEAATSGGDPDIAWTRVPQAKKFRDLIPASGEYVSVWNPLTQEGLTGALKKPQSQWIRRTIAKKLGKEEAWDYKVNPEVTTLLETVRVLTIR